MNLTSFILIGFGLVAACSGAVVIYLKCIGHRNMNDRSIQHFVRACEDQARLLDSVHEDGIAMEEAVKVANAEITAIHDSLEVEINQLKKTLLALGIKPCEPPSSAKETQIIKPPHQEQPVPVAISCHVDSSIQLPVAKSFNHQSGNILSLFWNFLQGATAESKSTVSLRDAHDDSIQVLDESQQLQAIVLPELDRAKHIIEKHQAQKPSC